MDLQATIDGNIDLKDKEVSSGSSGDEAETIAKPKDTSDNTGVKNSSEKAAANL